VRDASAEYERLVEQAGCSIGYARNCIIFENASALEKEVESLRKS